MDKTIKIEINDKYDFLDKYNSEKISPDLINYIAQESAFISKKDNITIEIYDKCDLDMDCAAILKKALEERYEISMKRHAHIDSKQVFFALIGIVCLILYMYFVNDSILKEILSIAAWVGIWEMLDLEFFDDAAESKKRRVLKILLNSKIVVKEL